MTHFRVWRSRFKREDRQQVTVPQTAEHRVSDTIEVMELELDWYLGTPIALASPSFSVRRIRVFMQGGVDMDWVFDRGEDFGKSDRRTD